MCFRKKHSEIERVGALIRADNLLANQVSQMGSVALGNQQENEEREEEDERSLLRKAYRHSGMREPKATKTAEISVRSNNPIANEPQMSYPV